MNRTDSSPMPAAPPANPSPGVKAAAPAGPRIDWSRVLFWSACAVLAMAVGVAIAVPPAVGPMGAVIILAASSAILFFFVWTMSGAGKRIGLFPDRGAAELAQAQARRAEYALLEAMLEPAIVTDARGAVIAANKPYLERARAADLLGESERPPAVDRLFGAAPGLAAPMFRLANAAKNGMSRAEVLPPLPRGTGPVERFEASVSPISGGRVLWRLHPLPDMDGGVNPLAASTQLFIDEAPIGFFAARPDGEIAYINRTLRSYVGLPELVQGKLRLRDFLREDPARVLRRDKRGSGSSARSEVTLKARDGVETPVVMLTSWGREDEDTEPLARILVYLPVVGATDAARLSPDPQRPVRQPGDPLFESAPFGMAVLDGPDPAVATIMDANGNMMNMAEGRAAPGTSFADLFDGRDGPASVTHKIRQAVNAPQELKLARTDGAPRTAHLYVSPYSEGRSVAYLVDVTEQKGLEARLAQSEKLQAIGQLVAAVAHDFNNILTAVNLNADQLLVQHPAGDPSFPGLIEIQQNVARASDLVRTLLAWSRQQTFKPEPLDISAVISDFSSLLRKVVGEKVQLEIVHGRDVPSLRSDKSQLQTALMNLATNARDAMAPKGGGTLTITTGVADADAAHALGHVHVQDGDYVVIDVADSGTGIPPELLDKIFEPFFTTKEAGLGTGLGLATVYGIVKQSGGYIYPISRPNKGATFRIYLPVCEPEAGELEAMEQERLRTRAEAARPMDLSGRGNILLVEDEQSVRQIAKVQLAARGYTVTEADSGESGLDILRANPGKFDVIVSDILMPGMEGPTMLQAARDHLGHARVIFISGFAEREAARKVADDRGALFLSKPFSERQLAEMVKLQIEALQRPDAA